MDTAVSVPPPTASNNVSLARPYPPSWVDRLSEWVSGLPGPNWAFYVGLWLVLFLIATLIKWWDGAYPVGTFFATHAAMTALVVYGLAGMHYLDRVAAAALRDFRPAMTISDAEYADLAYRLTNMPNRLAWLASVAGVILFLVRLPLITSSLEPLHLFTAPFSMVADTLFLSFMWATLCVVIYHTVHQLRIVRAIYRTYTRINLFEPGPLYAFSSLTALTAAAMTFGSWAWVSIAPGALTRPAERGITLVFPLLAVVMFVWPLLGLHHRLAKEKTRQQAEVARELGAIFTELRRRLHANELTDIDALNKAAATLSIEENRLDKIPTWPWRPETPRLLATAVLLPIVLWIIQQTLGRFFGR
jgi:hypothetical protein